MIWSPRPSLFRISLQSLLDLRFGFPRVFLTGPIHLTTKSWGILSKICLLLPSPLSALSLFLVFGVSGRDSLIVPNSFLALNPVSLNFPIITCAPSFSVSLTRPNSPYCNTHTAIRKRKYAMPNKSSRPIARYREIRLLNNLKKTPPPLPR